MTQSDVTERLGVARTPVRQALFRLQQEGYVEVLFRSGWRVLAFNFEQFEPLYDLRMVLETTAIDRLAVGPFQTFSGQPRGIFVGQVRSGSRHPLLIFECRLSTPTSQ